MKENKQKDEKVMWMLVFWDALAYGLVPEKRIYIIGPGGFCREGGKWDNNINNKVKKSFDSLAF